MRQKRRREKRNRRERTAALPFSTEEWSFWIAHGINYLLSSYSEGIWNPLFPEIYGGKSISRESIAQRASSHFSKDEDPLKLYVLAWCVHTKRTIFTYKQAAELLVKGNDPETNSTERAKEPRCDEVWKLFDNLAKEIQKKISVSG